MIDYTPMVGDIGCVAIRSFPVGPLIEVGEKVLRNVYHDRVPAAAADYQHAFTYSGSGFVFEAKPHGAGFAKLSSYSDVLWLPRRLTVEQRQQIQVEINQLIGTPYSFLDYLAISMHALDRPGAGWVEARVKSTKHQICSQLCDFLHNQVGDHIFADGRWEGFVTPMDLAATVMLI